MNSAAGKTSDLFSEAEHGDCELHVEFCVPQGSNSGVYLMGRYEVQIFDSFGKKELKYSDCSGLYQSHLPPPAFTGKPPALPRPKVIDIARKDLLDVPGAPSIPAQVDGAPPLTRELRGVSMARGARWMTSTRVSANSRRRAWENPRKPALAAE